MKSFKIDLSGEITKLMSSLCMSEDHSDVILCVGTVKIPAHKTILSARSSYFQRLFSSGFAEASQKEISLKVPLEAFKLVLKYAYTGRLSFGSSINQIIELLGLAEQYDFPNLKTTISVNLASILSPNNCFALWEVARLFSLEELEGECAAFIDIHCGELLTHDTFKNISEDMLCRLLDRDTFYAPEIDIVNAVRNWCTVHPNADAKTVLARIRWQSMSAIEMVEIIKINFVQQELLVEVVNESAKKAFRTAPPKTSSASANYLEDVNVASVKYNAEVISCSTENPEALLDVDFATYDFNEGFAYSYIRSQHYDNEAVTIKLGKLYFINHIRFLLRSDASREYSYRVDASADGKQYGTIVNHSYGFWRSWQELNFPPRLVQYIRLVGTESRNETVTLSNRQIVNGPTYYAFQVFGLQAMYRTDQPEFIYGCVKPTCNVATVQRFARVVQGAGGNNMLDENSQEFTCQGIGCESIMVQLNQAYWIDSVGLLLWSDQLHSHKYSFYIETSTDMRRWSMAVDKRNGALSSWQRFTFDARPVVFIKIVGIEGDAVSSDLICTYFECPTLRN